MHERDSAIKLLRCALERTRLPRDLNFFRAFASADKIVSSFPVRLDETLPQLVELAHSSWLAKSCTTLARSIDSLSRK
jgi:hypothetical protein